MGKKKRRLKMPDFEYLLDHYPTLLFFAILGIAAYLINIFSYYIFAGMMNIEYLLANTLSWSLSTLFAYFTSRIYVFKSRTRRLRCIAREFSLFIMFRALALLMESLLLTFAFQIAGIQEMISKLFASSVAFSLNAVFNQFLVFKKGTKISGWFNFFG
jgi:putative flippase GtrA